MYGRTNAIPKISNDRWLRDQIIQIFKTNSPETRLPAKNYETTMRGFQKNTKQPVFGNFGLKWEHFQIFGEKVKTSPYFFSFS